MTRRITIEIDDRTFAIFERAVGSRRNISRALQRACEDRAEQIDVTDAYLDFCERQSHDPRFPPAVIDRALRNVETVLQRQKSDLLRERHL